MHWKLIKWKFQWSIVVMHLELGFQCSSPQLMQLGQKKRVHGLELIILYSQHHWWWIYFGKALTLKKEGWMGRNSMDSPSDKCRDATRKGYPRPHWNLAETFDRIFSWLWHAGPQCKYSLLHITSLQLLTRIDAFHNCWCLHERTTRKSGKTMTPPWVAPSLQNQKKIIVRVQRSFSSSSFLYIASTTTTTIHNNNCISQSIQYQ